ncbi:hypothetical protein RHMOL_Rhmol04G0017700 [Rhododendron molle]|uniref:Uncharacterized protein n=1 Tax=Rhododendron molle TaxID=49168 RepID=A0ACC0NWD9_RHOML|nr:hypothetical protein RHMOL_Rhmol04G0017700 [Rhododendron molle]
MNRSIWAHPQRDPFARSRRPHCINHQSRTATWGLQELFADPCSDRGLAVIQTVACVVFQQALFRPSLSFRTSSGGISSSVGS